MLQIAHIEYSIQTKSLDIFTIGCNGDCKGCCNPEIKDWNLKGLSIKETISKLRDLNQKFNNLIDKIIIVGGDPVDAHLKYPVDVEYLLDNIKVNIDKPIYLFTRHKIEVIPQSLKNKVDYIKTGEYKPELIIENNVQYGIKLATSNQKIYKKEKNKWL